MPPRWIKKIGKAGRKVGRFIDKVTDDISDKIEETLDDGPVRTIVRCSKQVTTISRETVEICDDAFDKRQEMIAFASEISETLENFSDAGTLATIKELTAGEKVEAAMELAKGLNDVASDCVEKSVQMRRATTRSCGQ